MQRAGQGGLGAEWIERVVADDHHATLLGATGAIRRQLLVADADHDRARRLMIDAGEELRLAQK